MKNRWKATGFVLAAAALAVSMAMPAMAASRKKIGSVNIRVESDIQPELRFGEENIEVETRGGKYSFDYYEIENAGFEWMPEDIPEISIYLKADDGYYFSLSAASSVKLSGATYVKATKQDSSETLKLTVKLPSLAESVADLTEVILSNSGYAIWDEVRGAGSYEVRLYRNGAGVGASILETKDTHYDFKNSMTRVGSYSVKVRPVNGLNKENKGDWVESAVISLSNEQAEAIRNGTAGDIPLTGAWQHDDAGGWWYQHSDKSYTKNNWEEIKGQWYFFDENGYMKTGWIDWNGTRYYCAESGEMLRSTTTPDGYLLAADGSLKND
ncbi:MAG: cell wall-binding protein [Lachnospiraceae bacterium]|nr:cell wall-binding protein [Lachnospiraceae bacterium]